MKHSLRSIDVEINILLYQSETAIVFISLWQAHLQAENLQLDLEDKNVL